MAMDFAPQSNTSRIISRRKEISNQAVAGEDRFMVVAANSTRFRNFRGYDKWQPVAPSQVDDGLRVTVANPVMINAYKEAFSATASLFPMTPRSRISSGPEKKP